jgi:hypothetical protein
VKLWTVQGRLVLEALQRQGRVYVDLRYAGSPDPPRAYRWLADQLIGRIQGYEGRLPWWLHTRFPAWTLADPPGRADRDEVLLELEIAREKVAILRQWAWSRLIDGRYLALSPSEEKRWRRDCRRAGVTSEHGGSWLDPDPPPMPGPLEARLQKSFENLFDPRLPARAWRRSGRFGYSRQRGSEAVTEVLELESLRAVHELPHRDRDRGSERLP